MKDITQCRVCGSGAIKKFFDLGRQPFANALSQRPDEKENFYPLSLSWCGDCNLVQLNQTADPEELFSKYLWVTGTSKGANDFAEKFYTELVSRAGLVGGVLRHTVGAESGKAGYVLEVASNDGTFLKPFERGGYDVLGVDPAKNVADMAELAGIPTKCVFFGVSAAQKIVHEKGPANMIFARNVLAHVANTHDFVDGLRASLADNGVLAIETHYAKNILEGLQYDSMYHEHLCYFSLKSVERLLNSHGLYVFDVMRSVISGGAIVVYATKNKGLEPSAAVLQYRAEEEKSGVNAFPSWGNFAARSFEHREKLLKMLNNAKESGDVIVGWGASARSSTLLNFCGIDSKILPAIIDLNPLKQGRYTAGTHIPIQNPEAGMQRNPKTIFILAWNFGSEIMGMIKNKYGFAGRYVIPLPNEPRVVSS